MVKCETHSYEWIAGSCPFCRIAELERQRDTYLTANIGVAGINANLLVRLDELQAEPTEAEIAKALRKAGWCLAPLAVVEALAVAYRDEGRDVNRITMEVAIAEAMQAARESDDG